MAHDHIHTLRDYRGPRRVFINGNEVSHAVRADTRRGEVIYCPQPCRVHKRKRDEVYTRMLRGVVTIEFIENNNG